MISALVKYSRKRFDNRIARLANTVAISAEQMHGTENDFSERESCHMLYLFSKDRAGQVIEEFAQLILDTFTDEELLSNKKRGCHVIGMVHVKKDETPEKQFSKGIYDYWSKYDAKKASKSPNPNMLIDYIRIGHFEFQKSGELRDQIEWYAKGIRRLINIAKGQNFIAATNNPFSTIVKQLPEEKQLALRKDFYALSSTNILTEKDWQSTVSILEDILKGFDLTLNSEAKKYISWTNVNDIYCNAQETIPQAMPNHYVFQDKKSDRCVDLEFSSIHSVKGRTHLATLVLETYSKAHNMKAILKYLCNKPPKALGANHSRLKCQYVAMTRAKALLCLAMPIEFVDEKIQKLMQDVGWTIKIID